MSRNSNYQQCEIARRKATFDGFSGERFRLTRRTFTLDEAREPSVEHDAVVAAIGGHAEAAGLGDASAPRGAQLMSADEVVTSDER